MANYTLKKIDFNEDLTVMFITVKRRYFWLFNGKPILVIRHKNDTVSERLEDYNYKMYFSNSQPPKFYEELGGITFQDFKYKQSCSIRAFSKVCMWCHMDVIKDTNFMKKKKREYSLKLLEELLD